MTDQRATDPAMGSENAADAPRERVIDLSVEVAGTPEEVWTAIATGPGITAWFVPTTVEERVGGATTSKFGEGPEMLIPGRVAAWEPPRRLVFDGGEEEPGLAFEWLVETNAKGSCVVRLVNSGFVEGTPWDDQYDGLLEGWGLFMFNLQLHLAHFAGQKATSMLPMTMWVMPVDEAWPRLLADLGLPAVPVVGERIVATAADAPPLAGTVVRSEPARIALLLDEPAAGTAFLACEAARVDGVDQAGVSIWQYLYDDDATGIVERDGATWAAWLQAHAGS